MEEKNDKMKNPILQTEARSSDKCSGKVLGLIKRLFNYYFIPIFLMVVTPNAVMIIWFICQKCEGSVEEFRNVVIYVSALIFWYQSKIISLFSVSVVLGFAAWGIVTMTLIPGKVFTGPVTPKGNVPVYKDNGFYCYALTMLLLVILSYVVDVTVVYDRFDEIIATSCIFSLIFCLFLYIKGHIKPSSSDSGSSGHIIFDYYWGMELYPRVFSIDIKTFTNCRFGMTSWPAIIYIFALKSHQVHGTTVDSMLVSTVLQLAYITKFFWWEKGYMSTIDIMLDRAGYYICWGCLVFVPGFYTSVSHYLVVNPVKLGTPLALGILLSGLASLVVNYAADWQKQVVRNCDGECTIWGKKANIIRASYTIDNGEVKESILLVSGFWSISRHFHYLPELTLALCWSLPALFDNIFPYIYFLYLCLLLIHRSFRDDAKCSEKYGNYWTEYKKRVPFKIIPGLF